MHAYSTILKFVFSGLLLLSIFSCEDDPEPINDFPTADSSHVACKPEFQFHKKKYELHDKDLRHLFNTIKIIDTMCQSKNAVIEENVTTKFGSFIVYHYNGKQVKMVDDIYSKGQHLVATSHEIYFIDNCNIVTRMTKYAYRSSRVKSIYYFTYTDQNMLGCIVSHGKTLFHKKESWYNISDDILAKNWGNRIFHNIIRSHLQTKKAQHNN